MTNNRLKIFHILFSRGFAGSERSTAESCNQQCINHDVTIIIRKGSRKHGVSISDHLDARVNVIEISANWMVSRSLQRIISQYQPDVIHTHLRRSARAIAKISPSAATLATLHIGINGKAFTELDGIICNARWQQKEIPSSYAGLVMKAHNSITPQPKISNTDYKKLRQELGITPDTFLIGAVGRLHASKGWDTLIQAFQKVQGTKLALLFFGAGNEESALKELASKDPRIKFLGYRNDIKDLYQTFDLAVCPSRFEPLPRVILEAMDAGTPVLASNIGGCKELIDDYGGALFDVDDVNDLAEQLKLCVSSPMKPIKPDLSAHHVHNANAAIESFYRELINRKLVGSSPGLAKTA